jgi:hypothetical protein
MPAASENRAEPPSATSRVWLRKTSAAASGAATHGLTISADTPPIAKTPAKRPPGKRCDMPVSGPVTDAGSCSSYMPNIDSDSSTSASANAPSTQGFCKVAARPSPARPAAMPSAV